MAEWLHTSQTKLCSVITYLSLKPNVPLMSVSKKAWGHHQYNIDGLQSEDSGGRLNIKAVFPRYGDSHVKDRLFFNMGISIQVRRHLYIEAVGPQVLFFNTLRPRQNWRHFADNIFKWIFLNENVWIPIKISLKFVPRGPINYIPVLVQIMA